MSDLDSYRRLRQLLTGEVGFAGLLRPDGKRFRLKRCMLVMAISLPKAAL